MYYPDTRPNRKDPRYSIVASINAKWKDWQSLTDEEYAKEKNRLCEESVTALEKIIPDVRDKIDHLEAATPRTIQYYTQHASGASFGTKFEGLDVSSQLPEHAPAFTTQDPLGSLCPVGLGRLIMVLLRQTRSIVSSRKIILSSTQSRSA